MWGTRSLQRFLGATTETSGFHTQEGSSRKHRWPEVRRGSKFCFSGVYLVPRLLVLETGCCLDRFKSDMPPEGGIRGDFRTGNKKGKKKSSRNTKFERPVHNLGA